jgi:hypothetical protein
MSKYGTTNFLIKVAYSYAYLSCVLNTPVTFECVIMY